MSDTMATPIQELGIGYSDTAVPVDAADLQGFLPSDLAALIAALPSPVALLNRHGEIVAVSQAWRRVARESRRGTLVPCSVGQNYLQSCLRASGHHAKDAHEVSSGIRAVLDGAQQLFTFEYSYPLADQQRWILLQAASVRDGAQGAVVELTDISAAKYAAAERQPVWPGDRSTTSLAERQHLLDELAEARSRERAAAEEAHNLELFMMTASHEFRTPLTVIKSYLNGAEHQMADYLELPGCAQDGSQVLPLVQHAIHNARQAALQIGSLLDDLLQVSRARAGKVVVNPQRCELSDLVREVVNQQHQLQPARRLALHLGRNQHILVDADPALTRQVLTNLLDNARKYSSEDRPVDVSVEVTGHTVSVSVRDRGPGLPAEEQARIWDCFYQAPGVRYQPSHGPGLGLGLYVTRLIIDQHGGHVGVESTPGHGATFWFTLPLAEVPCLPPAA